MVTGKTVKFFTSKNNNAPQLLNVQGSMLALLDACLVSGIQVGTVAALTASGTTATATFGMVHNLTKHQIIRISGASQAEFNGDFKIKQIVNTNTITFELNTSATVANATGTINCLLAPLGFEKPFSSTTALGGGRAAFRSKDESLPNRPFLRVVDERISSYSTNYAKYAKVGIVENMTDIDTMTGVQAPYIASAATRNWNPTGSGLNIKNGWAKWYYCALGEYYPDSTSLADFSIVAGDWLVVGTDTGFYIMNSIDQNLDDPFNHKNLAYCYGFGAFESIADDDPFNHFLLATNYWETAQGISYRVSYATNGISIGSEDANYTAAPTPGRSVFLQRGYKKSAYAQAVGRKVTIESSPVVSGNTNGYLAPADKIGGVILQSPLLMEILDTSQFLPRGFLPLIKTIPHKTLYADLQLVEQSGRVFIAKEIYGDASRPSGMVMFDLGEA
ncbi:hypothetical protein E0H83_01170 [Acinetobacter terrestris]|uniref:hypothetical protein n=1 Tax=Acinetobacter terrestris TaxID=2529843 RepID=UPI00103E76C2|nr:hypothetical protein [Acinetobacter terrestris]TCB48381.1 hypothetical protein E0H83_01170 [Acinetobacter terrestris]